MSNHGKSAKRTTLVAATALSTLLIGATPSALADPAGDASQAQQKLRDLGKQAEILTEDYKKAQDDHEAKKRDLDRFTAEAANADRAFNAAKAQEEGLRGGVDVVARQAYEGARMNTISAMMSAETPDAFLDRATTLDRMSAQSAKAIHELSAATQRAAQAQRTAADARNQAARAEADSARIAADMTNRKKAMDAQIAEVKKQYNELSDDEKGALSKVGEKVGSLAGSGAAIVAVNAALSKQGAPYVWGAKGPSSFDCSGLVQWAYAKAGVSLPASTRGQVSSGRSVPRSQIKPGDLVFFYSSASHVGIYIGNGKMVHAPTEGEPVMTEEIDDMGQIHSIRRVAG